MRAVLGMLVMLAGASVAHAVDVESGKAKATAVCAACHGANGVSVSDAVPNLAAQRAGYLEAQLRFFKDGTRKEPGLISRAAIMNAIASQLSAEDIDGSVLLVEIYSTKLGADGKPLTGSDGLLVADKLTGYTAMARRAGWGADIPDILRNEDWNYAVFSPQKQHRPGVNQAECLACHKPLEKLSYTFTLKQLAGAAKGN